MDALIWQLATSGGLELLLPLWRPLLIGIALYYSSYGFILIGALRRRMQAGGGFVPLGAHECPELLIVMPTLLRRADELAGLQRAVGSVIDNGYPGQLTIAAAIDHAAHAPELCDALEHWAAGVRIPHVRLRVVRREQRGGKAMAIDSAVAAMEAERGPAGLPPVFFNMDADSELEPGSLERMVAKLVRPGRLGRRPMVVASNVVVPRATYWQGWRPMFTVRGQLALQVAREYMTSISLARHNSRLIPVSSVSGALYATWTELYQHGPRYAAFVRQLRFRDWLAWWLGAPPPDYARARVTPCAEAMTGPGDDTWVAWLALAARWRRGRIDLSLPRTPLHAFAELVLAYVARPIAYDPAAKIYTATPTTARGLFRQRVRWNSSRIWLANRFGWALWFRWAAGAVVYLDLLVVVALHGVILAGLLLWPLADRPAGWIALLLIANLGYAIIRGTATVLAMIQDNDVRGQWHKLLALPLSGVYHLTFNILTTVVGLVQDVFGFGVNTHFAPEQTLIRAGTGRIAIAYRLRRAALLCWRAAVRGDVPVGRFWLGWGETPWTTNGYAGWTDPESDASPVREGAVEARPRPAVARARTVTHPSIRAAS